MPSPVFYIAGHPLTGQSNFYRVITGLYLLPPDPHEKKGDLWEEERRGGKKKVKEGGEGRNEVLPSLLSPSPCLVVDAHFCASVNLSHTAVSSYSCGPVRRGHDLCGPGRAGPGAAMPRCWCQPEPQQSCFQPSRRSLPLLPLLMRTRPGK